MVRLAVQSHGLCSELGLDGFDLAEFIRRIFMEDMNHALTSGGKHKSRLRLIGSGINACGDWERLDDVSVVGVHDHQHLRIASRTEEPAVRLIKRQGRRASGGRYRPAGFNSQLLGIDSNHFILIFQIHIDSSLAIGDGELGRSTKVNGTRSSSTLRIDYRGAVWISIHD